MNRYRKVRDHTQYICNRERNKEKSYKIGSKIIRVGREEKRVINAIIDKGHKERKEIRKHSKHWRWRRQKDIQNERRKSTGEVR